jgi:hypothetical protein
MYTDEYTLFKSDIFNNEVQCSPDITLSFIPRIRIYRGFFLFPVSFKEILRKKYGGCCCKPRTAGGFPTQINQS